ncbi:MAG: DUF547 domain-containing protein [Planctomycetota bacterium]|nr:DUF547 domain-containing protein [Planctomycetota bacterium]
MHRSSLILIALLTLTIGCEIVIEDPNGLRNKKGSSLDLNNVDLTALNNATAKAKKSAAEARAVRKEALKKLARIERLISSLTGKRLKALPDPKPAPKPSPKTIDFDHTDLDTLLKKHVKNGLVNYKAWKKNDLKPLDAYLDRARATDPSKLASDKHRMAFWINIYNAWTLRSMLKLYPTKSILNHSLAKKGFGIWQKNAIKINGKDQTLNDIEHKILRPMGDARIHFAIVCASIGCPPLRSGAYTADNLGAQMDESAKVFFATKSKFKTDGNTVYLSKIFDWFKKDFGTDNDAVLKALAPYVKDEAAKKLMLSGKAKVAYLDYDWSINEQN